MKKFLVPIKLAHLNADPSNAQAGTFYFNTLLNRIRYYDGTSWTSLQKEILIETLIDDNNETIVDEWLLSESTTVEYILQITQGSKFRSSRLMLITNQSLVNYTEYAIMEIGDLISGLSINASTESSIDGDLGKLTIQISDALTNNAQVKLLKTIIS